MSKGAGDLPVTWAGEYDPAVTYLPRRIVSAEGGAYLSTATTTGNAPPNRTYWMPLGRSREAVFSTSSPVAGSGSPPYGVLGASTLLRFRVYLGAAGSSATTVKLYVNGVEVASVTVASGATSSSAAYVVALLDGDVLTVTATVVGTGVPSITAQADLAA